MANINKILLLNELLNDEITKYQGLSTVDLVSKLNLNGEAKNINYVVFTKIIEESRNKEKIKSLIAECNCVVKTINLEWNNNLKESMSLNVFKYMDIYKETWDSSNLKSYFLNNSFIFVVFKKDFNGSKLEKIKVWKMPNSILEGGVKETWELTKELISQGRIVNYIDDRGRYITYFPTSGDTKFIHVRPHAQSREDTLPLPVNDKYTNKSSFVKHSFWINSNFIKKIVVEDKYYE